MVELFGISEEFESRVNIEKHSILRRSRAGGNLEGLKQLDPRIREDDDYVYDWT